MTTQAKLAAERPKPTPENHLFSLSKAKKQMSDYSLTSKQWKYLIAEGARAFDAHPSDEQLEQFFLYAEELLTWNRKTNLTAITDPHDVATKHFVDSLAAAPLIPSDSRLLDIGSGGGFPGIPLKIIRPSLSVTLMDAFRKKVSFQKHVIRTLKLENIKAIHARAEHLAEDSDFAHTFDVVISRALSALDQFFDMALPLLAEKGLIIAMKGKISDKETNALYASLEGKAIALQVRKYRLPFANAERAIVVGGESVSECLECLSV